MKAKSLLALFLLTIGVFSYVYFAIEKPAKEKEASGNKEDILAPGKLDGIRSIKMTVGEKKVELVRQTIGWKITSGDQDLASQSKVENLISALEKFKKTRVLFDSTKLKTEKTDLAQFGLNPPKAILEYQTTDLPNPIVLQIGQANPSGNATYVKTEKDGLVLATQDLDFVALQGSDDFREMRLTTVASSDFEEVEYTWNGKTTKFKRENEVWTMTSPYKLPIDQDFTKSFMDKIAFVRANKFISTAAPNLSKPDLKILVGFKKDVKDLRTSESDSRPQGLELRLIKLKRAKDKKSKEKQEDFDYYAKGDKTLVGSIAQFHYDNFTKPPEDFIKKTFDVFLNADVQKLTISKPATLDLAVSKTANGFSLVSGKDSTDADTAKVNKLLDQIRALRANKFLEISKPMTKLASLRLTFDLKDNKSLTMNFDMQKDSTILWFTQNDQTLRYVLPKDAVNPKDFEISSLKVSTVKDVNQVIKDNDKKTTAATTDSNPVKKP